MSWGIIVFMAVAAGSRTELIYPGCRMFCNENYPVPELIQRYCKNVWNTDDTCLSIDITYADFDHQHFLESLQQELQKPNTDPTKPDFALFDVIYHGVFSKHLAVVPEWITANLSQTYTQGMISSLQSPKQSNEVRFLPAFVGIPVLFYRKDILQKYGLNPPNTWAEMERICNHVLPRDQTGQLSCFRFPGAAQEALTCFGLELLASHVNPNFVSMNGTITIKNNGTLEAVRLLKRWRTSNLVSSECIDLQGGDAPFNGFLEGKSLFLRDWAKLYYDAKTPEEIRLINERVGAVLLPSGYENGPKHGTRGGYDFGVVDKGSGKMARHVWEFVNYLASEPEAVRRFAAMHFIPPQMDILFDGHHCQQALSQGNMTLTPFVCNLNMTPSYLIDRPSAVLQECYKNVSAVFATHLHEFLANPGLSPELLMHNMHIDMQRAWVSCKKARESYTKDSQQNELASSDTHSLQQIVIAIGLIVTCSSFLLVLILVGLAKKVAEQNDKGIHCENVNEGDEGDEGEPFQMEPISPLSVSVSELSQSGTIDPDRDPRERVSTESMPVPS